MERGCAPVGHKGISTSAGLLNLSAEEISKIRSSQRPYKIELQHVTQKDTGLAEDPVCEMTKDAHIGVNTRHIVQHSGSSIHIVRSSLKTPEALAFLEKNPNPKSVIIANVLHFREGRSLIDRSAFSTWKQSYWKNRASTLPATLRSSTVRVLFMMP